MTYTQTLRAECIKMLQARGLNRKQVRTELKKINNEIKNSKPERVENESI